MAFYETTFIARPDLTPAETDKLADDFAAIVSSMGGKVIKRENWGIRNLAYKIDKQKKGHYIHLGIESNSDVVNELDRKYRLSEDILRSLTVKVEKISKDQSAILRSSGDDDFLNEENE